MSKTAKSATGFYSVTKRWYADDEIDDIELEPGTIMRCLGGRTFEVMTGQYRGVEVEFIGKGITKGMEPIPPQNHRRIVNHRHYLLPDGREVVPFGRWNLAERLCKIQTGPVVVRDDGEYVPVGNVHIPNDVMRQVIPVPEGQRAFVFPKG
jgi:hypothetical protein